MRFACILKGQDNLQSTLFKKSVLQEKSGVWMENCRCTGKMQAGRMRQNSATFWTQMRGRLSRTAVQMAKTEVLIEQICNW